MAALLQKARRSRTAATAADLELPSLIPCTFTCPLDQPKLSLRVAPKSLAIDFCRQIFQLPSEAPGTAFESDQMTQMGSNFDSNLKQTCRMSEICTTWSKLLSLSFCCITPFCPSTYNRLGSNCSEVRRIKSLIVIDTVTKISSQFPRIVNPSIANRIVLFIMRSTSA